MSAARGYTIVYADPVFEHIRAIETKHHSLIKDTILEQLQFTPTQPSRNRKPLTPPTPFLSSWEIRFGAQNMFRVLYDVNESEKTVEILGIGIKIGNKLYFAGELYSPQNPDSEE
jgi:mRNA-degrading endonuclease RelE of RelBE toxin-antitoxin system